MNVKHLFASIGLAVGGAFVGAKMPMGGYAGLKLGLAFGTFFYESEDKIVGKHNSSELTTKNKSSLNVVPYIIGTDMSVGTVIYLPYLKTVDAGFIGTTFEEILENQCNFHENVMYVDFVVWCS